MYVVQGQITEIFLYSFTYLIPYWEIAKPTGVSELLFLQMHHYAFDLKVCIFGIKRCLLAHFEYKVLGKFV